MTPASPNGKRPVPAERDDEAVRLLREGRDAWLHDLEAEVEAVWKKLQRLHLLAVGVDPVKALRPLEQAVPGIFRDISHGDRRAVATRSPDPQLGGRCCRARRARPSAPECIKCPRARARPPGSSPPAV